MSNEEKTVERRENLLMSDIHIPSPQKDPTSAQTKPHLTLGCLSVNYLIQKVRWGDQNHKTDF